MNSTNHNQKETLGEIAVGLDLTKLGYDIYLPFGDHSKVDLIVLSKNHENHKIQV